MGVHKYFKVFGTGKVVGKNFLKDKRVAVDANFILYTHALGTKSIKTLTDKEGNSTVVYNTLLNNLCEHKSIGLKGVIYVFDNPKANPHKIKERERRKAMKEKAEKKLEALKCSDSTKGIDSCEKQTFSMTTEIVTNVKKILNGLGIAWIDAPYGYEAEHLCAELAINNVVDVVYTSDSDAIMFGATTMVRKSKKHKNKLELHEIKEVLMKHNLTREQLVHLGVVLGTDFAKKTPRIGEKTILSKGLNVELTEEQKDAVKIFISHCPYSQNMVHKETPKKQELIDWLVNTKNFNRARVEKILKNYK